MRIAKRDIPSQDFKHLNLSDPSFQVDSHLRVFLIVNILTTENCFFPSNFAGVSTLTPSYPGGAAHKAFVSKPPVSLLCKGQDSDIDTVGVCGDSRDS